MIYLFVLTVYVVVYHVLKFMMWAEDDLDDFHTWFLSYPNYKDYEQWCTHVGLNARGILFVARPIFGLWCVFVTFNRIIDVYAHISWWFKKAFMTSKGM